MNAYERRRLVAGIAVIFLFLILLIGEAMRDRTLRRWAYAWLGFSLFCLSVIACCVWLLVRPASAHDSQHPELNDWFMGLHAKGGAWCCDGKDAVTVDEWTMADGHYRAKVAGEWVEVPDDAIVEGPNRAIQAKIWPKYVDGHPEARCFIPGAMG